MSDLPKRLYRGTADRAHADTELALSRMRRDLQTQAYSPADTADWADPPPTTIAEAIDRIVASLGTPP